MSGWARLGRARSAATAVEFAIVAAMLIPLCLGTLDVGLLMWTKGALQSAAAAAARCAAIASPDCADVRQFAVARVSAWTFAGLLASTDVAAPSTVCVSGAALTKVSISSSHWSATVIPQLRGTLTAVAYFPTGASC